MACLRELLLLTWVSKRAQAPVMCLLVGALLNLELVQPEFISLVLRLVQLAGLGRAQILLQRQTRQRGWGHSAARYQLEIHVCVTCLLEFPKSRHCQSISQICERFQMWSG
jgi:hypothetical protein